MSQKTNKLTNSYDPENPDAFLDDEAPVTGKPGKPQKYAPDEKEKPTKK